MISLLRHGHKLNLQLCQIDYKIIFFNNRTSLFELFSNIKRGGNEIKEY